ncbi:type II toxin-antitoxin system HicB family antitoxin [Nostoc sp.]|uniref:type II toxin-antitoxin system HicB family antitoxin n=1 Tax=Nostoc sp. TaxID=1180 RepID=UPI002FFCC1AA
MNLPVKTTSQTTVPKLNYDVLIENQPDGTVKATLLGLPDCQGLGNTETEAIEKLSQSFQHCLESAKIVTLAIEVPKVVENPWLKIAGKYKDDSQFDKMLEYIEEYRRELDERRVTRNRKDFEKFTNLRLEDWTIS